jgi:hypothetical protein
VKRNEKKIKKISLPVIYKAQAKGRSVISEKKRKKRQELK